MVSLTAAFTLLAVTVSCLGSPLVRHESRRALPPHWEQSHRAHAHAILPLRIGLAQSNIDRIGELLLDVSHPDSENYGNHWTPAKVAETFRPSAETVDTVREWLQNEGIDASRIRLSKSGGWMEANVSVAEAEQLLKTEYHVYNHALTDVKHVGCASGYHVPEHISKHVELITPTVHFDAILSGRGSEMYKRKLPDAHPGQPGFGGASPKSVGTIKVCLSATSFFEEVPTVYSISIDRTSLTSWRTVTHTSLPTAFVRCTTLSISPLRPKRTALVLVCVINDVL